MLFQTIHTHTQKKEQTLRTPRSLMSSGQKMNPFKQNKSNAFEKYINRVAAWSDDARYAGRTE